MSSTSIPIIVDPGEPCPNPLLFRLNVVLEFLGRLNPRSHIFLLISKESCDIPGHKYIVRINIGASGRFKRLRKEFEQVYVHFSANDKLLEFNSLFRWIVLNELVAEWRVKVVVHMDNDVLPLVPITLPLGRSLDLCMPLAIAAPSLSDILGIIV